MNQNLDRRSGARLLGPLLLVLSCSGIGCGAGEDVIAEPPAEEPQPPGKPADPMPRPMPGPVRPAGVTICASTLAAEHAATKKFWAEFGANNRAARGDVLKALQAATKQHPSEGALALTYGLASLWRVAEPMDSEVNDQLGFILAALAAKSELERAYKLCPTDYRIPAWLGPVFVNMGRSTNDQMSIDRGLAVLQEGIDHYPSFVTFSKLLVYADVPRTDPDFQKALQAVEDNIAACGDPLTAPSADPACGNSASVPHNLEGAQVFLGDVYTKAGRREDALRYYQLAQKLPAHASWSFQQLLRDRITSLDDRLKAYADADPKNDPEAVWTARYQCAICHQR